MQHTKKSFLGFKKEELIDILKISAQWGAISGLILYLGNYFITYIYSLIYHGKSIFIYKIAFIYMAVAAILGIFVALLAIIFYHNLPFKNLYRKLFALRLIFDLSIILIFLRDGATLFGLLVFTIRIILLIPANYIYAKKTSKKLEDKVPKNNLIQIPIFKKNHLIFAKKEKTADLNPINKIFLFLGKLIFFTIFSVIILELLSLIILNLNQNYVESYKDLKYFEVENYDTTMYTFPNSTREQIREFILEFYDGYKVKFHPYLAYDVEPFQGKYITLKESSVGIIRETTNPCATKDSKKIWFFGGSTAFGYLNRDNGTIASLLSKKLCEQGFSANITNYGTHGYQNTQELIKFLLLLKKEPKPDLIIFYDGFNDIYSVFQSGEVDLPQNLENRYLEFNSRDKFNIIHPLIKKSYTIKFLQKYIIKPKQKPITFNPEEKSIEIVNNYIKNVKIINAITSEYEITVLFIWQPTLFDRKQFYGQEHYINQTSNQRLRELTLLTSEKIKQYNKTILVLSDLFDENYPFMVYNDFIHTSEVSNEIIASVVKDVLIYN